MPGRATGVDVFNVLCDFYSQSKLSWNKCVAICTNGAASMTGKHSGVVVRDRELVPNITQTHCMIHHEALAARHLGQSMSEVLSLCVKAANSIKTRPLHSRLFLQLCNELGSDCSNLLLDTEVQRLSR